MVKKFLWYIGLCIFFIISVITLFFAQVVLQQETEKVLEEEKTEATVQNKIITISSTSEDMCYRLLVEKDGVIIDMEVSEDIFSEYNVGDTYNVDFMD